MKTQTAPFDRIACHTGAPDSEAKQIAKGDECEPQIVAISGCGHRCRCGGQTDGFPGYGYLPVSCQLGDKAPEVRLRDQIPQIAGGS